MLFMVERERIMMRMQKSSLIIIFYATYILVTEYIYNNKMSPRGFSAAVSYILQWNSMDECVHVLQEML